MERASWNDFADVYAFVGNSLLRPMTQTSDVGLDPSFWEAFPAFGSAALREAADACGCRARVLREAARRSGEPAALRASVEFTRLFVGPPKPAAPPWETMYAEGAGGAESAGTPDAAGALDAPGAPDVPDGSSAPDDVPTVGFGRPTFEMRALLRAAGLELANENHQYEDHAGIELLYLATRCRAATSGVAGAPDAPAEAAADVASMVERLSGWLPRWQAAVEREVPDGYFAPLIALVIAALCRHRELMA